MKSIYELKICNNFLIINEKNCLNDYFIDCILFYLYYCYKYDIGLFFKYFKN